MDKRALSDPQYVRSSPMLLYYIASLFGEPGSWGSYFNYLKHIGKGTSLEEKMCDDSSKRKIKRRVDKLRKAEGDVSGRALFPGTELPRYPGILAKRNQGLDKPVSNWWYVSEVSAFDIKKKFPDSPISHFWVFLTTLENRQFDWEEMMLWMLCAYIEWIYLDKFVRLRCSIKKENIFVPLNLWVPKAEDGRLSTTRYRVLSEFFENRDDRNYRHLVGPRFHSGTTIKKHYRKMSVKHAMLLEKPDSINSPDEFQYLQLFRLVHFFEWIQLDMLSNHIPAQAIEATFSRIHEIERCLEKELYRYFDEHNV